MVWYYYVGSLIGLYFLIYIIFRIVVSVRNKEDKNPYRSKYYGR